MMGKGQSKGEKTTITTAKYVLSLHGASNYTEGYFLLKLVSSMGFYLLLSPSPSL